MDHSLRETFPARRRTRRKRGFALIVTLSLMILLTVIAVGLLTLSSISLRSSSHSSGMATAKANARMALMLAMDELQKQTGPDTRVTAKADVLNETNPPVLGVWRSWEGEDHERSGANLGRPASPGNYPSKKNQHFLRWLVSGDAGSLIDSATPPDTTAGPGKAILLGERSVGNGVGRDKLQVHLTPTLIDVKRNQGAYAWWISGENQKARLPKPYQPSSDTAGRWAMNAKSHAVADPKVFRMDDVLANQTLAARGITLQQADLISTAAKLPASKEFFHDLSATSTGLLTNVATGGWKKDLSLLTENWSQAGTSNLPFFRVKPDLDTQASIPTSSNATPAKSMIYPWAGYRGSSSNTEVIYRHGAVTSWENLKDYALLYKRMAGPSGKPSIAPYSVEIKGDAFNFLHKVRILPVIARFQWVFSHSAGPPPPPPTNQPAYPAGSLQPRLLLTPVLTMWNPYNVELNFTNTPLVFKVSKPLPTALKYTVGGVTNAMYNSLLTGSTNNQPALSSSGQLIYQISASFSLKPGENRIFSPTSTTPVAADGNPTVVLSPGYRAKGGHYFGLKTNTGGDWVTTASSTIKAVAKFDTSFADNPAGVNSSYVGVGVFLDMLIGNANHLVYRMAYPPTVAALVYKPINGLAASNSLSSLAGNPSPFMTTVFGARMASRTHLAAKGFVQSSPFVNYTAMGGKDKLEITIQKHYGGTNHPVNSPFDFSFEAVGGAGDSLLPNEKDATKSGYIVTGFTSADGLSRCVIDELPTRPLQSLAELQNWDLRYENPIPPFCFNIIGNSDATPLLPADAVVNSADGGPATNLQHDDSYCANHLLFDDWFFSSIAPDPTDFGTTGKGLKTTYTDFLTGESPLPNHAYKALQQDVSGSVTGNADTLYNENVAKSGSWKKIASRLEVEGMFNVNSTSVAAWRALLGHARNQRVPLLRAGGVTDLSDESDYAFSRFSVAGDVEAKEQGSSGAFPESAEFAGYRILDENILDVFADEIVKQVRLRGPFLSLSEFVNRQLSSGDLALAGTIQAALNQLEKSGSTNPYQGITSVISRIASANPISGGNAEYKFPDAAVGQATYGLPGWTRQADVLRALAPILNARDDTFTIRGYGDARDAKGNVISSAVCEAVVRRTREFVDPAEAADIATPPTKEINRTFGRRYEFVSFRWLNPSEV